MDRVAKGFWQMICLAFHPIPNVLAIAQTGSIVIAIAGLTGKLVLAGQVVPALTLFIGAVAGLVLIAAVRLQLRLNDLNERKPLESEEIDVDQDFHRLIVRNPNSFVVKNANVQVESTGRSGNNPDNTPMPPQGYRFPWSSLLTGKGTTTFDLNAGGSGPVDIAVTSGNVFGFVQVSGDAMRPMRPMFPQTSGRFSVHIVLQADDIPAKHVYLDLTNPPLKLEIRK